MVFQELDLLSRPLAVVDAWQSSQILFAALHLCRHKAVAADPIILDLWVRRFSFLHGASNPVVMIWNFSVNSASRPPLCFKKGLS